VKVKELIELLSTLDPDLPVCGESETGTWDLVPEESTRIYECVQVGYKGPIHPKAIILGYTHR
jgi:hypothetical protein